jgi:putative membrane protein
MKRTIIFAAAALIACPAFAQSTKPAAPHTVDLHKYVEDAAGADMFEVKASQLALQRSQDPAIREFAQQMVAEHTDSANKLKMELEKAKVEVVPPKTLAPEKQAMLDRLMNVGIQDFNKMYMSMQIAGHEEALKVHSEFASSGADNFQKFAGTMTTHVKDHLRKAQRIDAALPENSNSDSNK